MIINGITKMKKKEFLQFHEEYIQHLKEYFVHYMDGKVIQTKEDYLLNFKKAYNLPSYLKDNLDAFYDSMRDLDFREEQGFIIVIYNFRSFLKNSSKDKDSFISIMNNIAFNLERECLTTTAGWNHIKSFDVYLIDDDLSGESYKDITMSKKKAD
ncbi:barstar family protein [Breznakia pachnodae]|uniref:RNAse (Barnase) inhibitor barstar n=1 Tax=Breznakia pachnodae TaxID=265178 RepID=A0ABU0E162_9FIRM|nr:barstar family protein [Breznakia pachnodae]MDQ0360610.1 RNAse (barnase) inhibitor barstar [Breznakia pachnodae]